jgi:uncharacterized membrane protein SpoIIM required for sporulation
MRTQDEFVNARKPDWTRLDEILARKPHLHALQPSEISEAMGLYRSVCADLMQARSSGYETAIVAYLDGLAALAHNRLYGARRIGLGGAWPFVFRTFPQTLRRNVRFFALACALLFVPLVATLVATLVAPELAMEVLPRSMLEGAAASYAEGHEGRDSGVNAFMAGFYVNNNVGVAFRCFATGILFGLGSAFFLLYNGIVIGAVIGYVIHVGHADNILTFVCGHAPFELIAIAVAGGAGLQMGYALVRTNGRTRLGSLRAQAPDLAALVLGAAFMLAIAALIEGFWSPSSVAPPVKWVAAGVFSVLVAVFLSFGGRGETRR